VRLILCPVGSSGDVHPFIGLGIRLRERGHDVVMVVNGLFEPLVRSAGLGYEELGTKEEFLDVIRDPNLWHSRKGTETVFGWVAKGMRRQYEAIARQHRPGETVLVNSALGFGARIAHDKMGVPLASIHLQPAIFRSVHDTPVMPAGNLPRGAPAFMKRFVYWLADVMVLDRTLDPHINAFRGELGLPPIRHATRDYWHSPQLTLGLFPEWFAPVQPDWPASVRLTGFPLYDERGVTPPPSGLEAFLAEHPRPVVFTPGSANVHAQDFFAAAVGACLRLDRPGVLLTRFPEQVPRDLPPKLRHFEFVPLSQLLPHAAALVHHGGIGTASQAMAAGIPQVIMPLSHDQPDNAARVKRLGIGDAIVPRRFTPERLSQMLASLMGSGDVATACRDIARRLRGVDAITQSCDLIEQLKA